MLFVAVVPAGVSVSRQVRGEASGRQRSYRCNGIHNEGTPPPSERAKHSSVITWNALAEGRATAAAVPGVSGLFTTPYYFNTDDNVHLGQQLYLWNNCLEAGVNSQSKEVGWR